MPFAPHEIENKRFVVALRGYQTDEVEAFLRAVAADYRALQEELESISLQRTVADVERIMASALEEAEREARAIREAAELEAAELRDATQRAAATCLAEVTRQAKELHRLEEAFWARLHALEHVVIEGRQALSHVAGLYPMTEPGSNEAPYGEAPSLALETNSAPATAAR